MLGINQIHHGDCLELMREIDDESIDMILCDLPYGITDCKWDSIIPLDALWNHYKRIIKKNGAIVLTASQPFTSALIMSNPSMFKYCWIWRKKNHTGFANAKKQPLRNYEDIVVFCQGKTRYFAQMTRSIKSYAFTRKRIDRKKSIYASGMLNKETVAKNTGLRYPMQIISCASERGLHPTQKPVALFKYLIKTYTLPGELILDNCSGSGTTAIACLNTRRRFICIEKEKEYVEVSRKRVHQKRIEILQKILT